MVIMEPTAPILRHPVTLAEVARTAGVSSMTVSRVVNGDPRVSVDTCQRVRESIEQLGYRPPPAELDGRRRRSRSHLGLHTGRIAVLIPDLTLSALCTPLSIRWLRGLDRPLAGTGMQIILTRLPTPTSLPPWINRRHIDGLIIRSPTIPQPWLIQALRHLPQVWIFEPGSHVTAGDIVDPHDELIGKELGQRVKAQDKGPVLVLDSMTDHIAHRRRVAGLISVLGADQVIHRPLIAPVGQMISEHPQAKTVFLPGTGVSIAHAAQALRKMANRDRPWLVTCNHDRALLSSLEVPITNIDIRPEEIGDQAARQILARIADPGAPRSRLLVPHQWEDGPFSPPHE